MIISPLSWKTSWNDTTKQWENVVFVVSAAGVTAARWKERGGGEKRRENLKIESNNDDDERRGPRRFQRKKALYKLQVIVCASPTPTHIYRVSRGLLKRADYPHFTWSYHEKKQPPYQSSSYNSHTQTIAFFDFFFFFFFSSVYSTSCCCYRIEKICSSTSSTLYIIKRTFHY